GRSKVAGRKMDSLPPSRPTRTRASPEAGSAFSSGSRNSTYATRGAGMGGIIANRPGEVSPQGQRVVGGDRSGLPVVGEVVQVLVAVAAVEALLPVRGVHAQRLPALAAGA